MKSHFLFAGSAALLLTTSVLTSQAQEGAQPPAAAKAEETKSPATADLGELVAKIQGKLRAGKQSEADLTEDIKAFDDLLAKYKDQKGEDVAEILFMKGTLYLGVFKDTAKGIKILEQVKVDFPGTKRAAAVDGTIANLQKSIEADKTKTALVGKPAPELNFHWASREGLTQLSSLKGKVVVLDFWATWCGPCVRSFPEIKQLTDHYKGYEVEVIGVTSIQGRVFGLEAKPIDCKDDKEKELKLMTDYIKAKEINWTIAFSTEPVFNPEYGVTGIPHMAIIAPDGKISQNGIHPAGTPFAEKTAMIDKLLKEFKLKTP